MSVCGLWTCRGLVQVCGCGSRKGVRGTREKVVWVGVYV